MAVGVVGVYRLSNLNFEKTLRFLYLVLVVLFMEVQG